MSEKKEQEEKNRGFREWVKSVGKSVGSFFRKVFRKKRTEDAAETESNEDGSRGKQEGGETPEGRFLTGWTEVLSEKADVFTGLYAGLERVAAGRARKPANVLREWRTRTRYQWEGQSIQEITDQCLSPLDENNMPDECAKWARLLLQAAEAAGIEKDPAGALVLDERTATAYTEWDGTDLYMEDTVEVLTPAWYLNGKVIEQGQCRKERYDVEE